jgi:hypothetical protein
MALGADSGSVVVMVLRGAFWQVGIGLAPGIPAAIDPGYLIASHRIISRQQHLYWFACLAKTLCDFTLSHGRRVSFRPDTTHHTPACPIVSQ